MVLDGDTFGVFLMILSVMSLVMSYIGLVVS